MGKLSRRGWMRAAWVTAAGAGATAAARVADRYGLIPPDHGGLYGAGHTLTYAAQRLATAHSMAREFTRAQISKAPFANGPALADADYARMRAAGFADWRLTVDGLVARPGSFSLADLRSMPARRQITHLACEEGWSFIAEWIGVPLSHVLDAAGAGGKARFVVYRSMEPGWGDSIDMADALHPQTLVVYAMNDGDLPGPHGGPLRMRVPRQLGYKSVKFLNRITVVDSLKGAPGGGAYSWYAGM